MNKTIEKIYNKINIQEDIEIINDILKQVYINKGISTKELALKNYIPIPIATVIKKELIKAGLLKQEAGVRLTLEGNNYVEETLNFKNINLEVYQKLINNDIELINELVKELQDTYDNRPEVDVTIDQSKCTVETALKRALLCLKQNNLINKNILCLGDDDLVSIALAFIVKKIFNDNKQAKIVVVDKDVRILNYIEIIASKNNLSIDTKEQDLSQGIYNELIDKFDCVFIDPPYTINGIELFVSRALVALKNKKDKTIYLSYAHRSSDLQLEIQKLLNNMNVVASEIIKSFNEYEGAGILGSKSQMLIIKTTSLSSTTLLANQSYNAKIYTHDYYNIKKEYSCQNCHSIHKIGKNCRIQTIEQLKRQGCHCGCFNFNLLKRVKDKTNNEIHDNSGKHTILDLYDCDATILESLSQIKELMLNAAYIARATIVTSDFHQFNPYGISGVIIIKESHLTIHTWPEYNYAAIDIFTCGDTLAINEASEYIAKRLKAKELSTTNLNRMIVR